MKIWHISDSHTLHNGLIVLEGIDMVIFSGDCSNPREVEQSRVEIIDFLNWFDLLPIKHKIFVAGNHDVAIERGRILKEEFHNRMIHYLENDWVEVLGLKIWGSPVTPSFGVGWAWNKPRHKLYELWAHIPDDTDVIVTHGPPKGILDLSEDRQRNLEQCGCKALYERMLKIKPKLMCFGHIHNYKDIRNSGVLTLTDTDGTQIICSNASAVKDNAFGEPLISNGNIILL